METCPTEESARLTRIVYQESNPMAASRSGATSAYPLAPSVLDFALVFAGVMLSVLVLRLGAVHLRLALPGDGPLRGVASWLKPLLALPQGVTLMWPVFLGLQRLFGRTERLAWGEWLWASAWAGATLLTAVAAWKEWGQLPEGVWGYYDSGRQVWYEWCAPCLAVLALGVTIYDAVQRPTRPWTHALGLALTLWPALPLAVALAL